MLAVSVGLVWYLLFKSGVKGLDATHTTLAKALTHENKLIDREYRAIKAERASKAGPSHDSPEPAQPE